MDTTHNYIIMCDTKDIQKTWQPEEGDIFWDARIDATQASIEKISKGLMTFSRRLGLGIVAKGIVLCDCGEEIELYPFDKFYPQDNCIWLPRQDQLQNMAWESLGTYCSNKMNSLTWGIWDFYNSIDDLDSMEQLWLAFVMKKKFNKVWTGGEWIKI